MIAYTIPGMVFFAMSGEYGTGEHGDNYGCKQLLDKWFRQDLPAGSQIDLLLKGSVRFCKRHACASGQIFQGRITLSSTGFHFAPKLYHGCTLVVGDGEFVKPEGFNPAFQHNGIRHTYLPGTDLSYLAKTPRLPPTSGVHGPKMPAASQRFVRAEVAALGVSFNAQSQAPDIPNISTRAAILQYTASLQAQYKAPDIPLLSLRASTKEILASFNAQDQAPDDLSVQDRQCDPREFFVT